jgi:hypothetical protein
MESDADVLQYMIRHVFLPPKLPQESESDDSLMDHHLLLQVQKASRRFIESIRASDEATSVGTVAKWKPISKMLHNMRTLHQARFLIKGDLVSAFEEMEIKG